MDDHPSRTAVEAWIALNRVQQTTIAQIERGFRDQGLPSYAWYDALWALEGAGEAGLRPFEIERRLLIAQSNISRLIDRMAAKGAVVRQQCLEDGRGHNVIITNVGRELRKRMWPIYAGFIHTLLDVGLDDQNRGQLAESLGWLATLSRASDRLP